MIWQLLGLRRAQEVSKHSGKHYPRPYGQTVRRTGAGHQVDDLEGARDPSKSPSGSWPRDLPSRGRA